MTIHVTVKIYPDERIRLPRGVEPLTVYCLPKTSESTVSNNIGERLHNLGIAGHPTAIELMLLATAVFQADTRVPRSHAADRWTRHFVLHLPVRNPELWQDVIAAFSELLGFLTGDVWEIMVRPGKPVFHQYEGHRAPQVETGARRVSLFSGGMDSFLGVARLLESPDPLVLVAHHASSNGVLNDQDLAWDALCRLGYRDQTYFVPFYVAKKRGIPGTAKSELTTRSRSIVFLALGILVAASLHPGTTLYVPENGFVSLNVPLVNSRLGSLSTRTTHPYLIHLLRQILRRLDIPVGIDLPLRFKTKGQLLQEATPQIRRWARTRTVSCAHPVDQRLERGADYRRHCGYCFPCLIRRAALHVVGLDDPGDYRVDVLRDAVRPEKLIHVHAVRAAVHEYRSQPTSVLRLLQAGPLPGTQEDRERYFEVWRQGMEELAGWLERA